MRPLSTLNYVIRRLVNDWKLLLGIFLGIVIASTLVTGAPVYIQALEKQGLTTAIDRAPGVFLDIFMLAPNVPLDAGRMEDADRVIDESVERHIRGLVRGREQYLRGPTFLVGLPRQPISEGRRVSRGYMQSLSNLEHHTTFLQGRMATDKIMTGPAGPIVEAVLGRPSADVFGIAVGDLVTFTPSLNNHTRMQAKIVGIFDPTDPVDEYWQGNASIFVDPGPLPEAPDMGVEVDPEEPPVAAFVTREAFINGAGEAFPGTLITSTWMIFIDEERLKEWPASKSVSRIDLLEEEFVLGLPGAAVLTGIKALVSDYNERSFFSRVPLVLLMSVMVVTVLYCLGMMVSYLVQSRDDDVVLLRGRGASTLQLMRLYAAEGLVLAAVAALVAPFLAMGCVAAAGKLAYFGDITGGDFLPVEMRLTPFLVAIGTCLLSMAIFVVPGVLGARIGLVTHKLRSSRPLSQPFFQRYNLDLGLLVVGGLLFWELSARGQLVSGGLFKNIEVNEALLLAPVLMLTVVALMFMRFFPLFVRFISGESATLMHLALAASLVLLAPYVISHLSRDDGGLASAVPLLLIVALAVAYWSTSRTQGLKSGLWGLATQTGIVALVILLQPIATKEIGSVSMIALIAIVPLQILYRVFQWLGRAAPVWVSIGLWHMARDPMRYSWLVLLLVMVTGLGVLSTTVGGTLERSQNDRILYDTAADIRVTGTPRFFNRRNRDLKQLYLTIPGVTAVSMALRVGGSIGTSFAGNEFQALAVESRDFQYISWYREDFSTRPLSGVMRALNVGTRSQPLAIPMDAKEIGVWAKPLDAYPNVYLWMVIKDARDVAYTVTLGGLGVPEWHQITAKIPAHLEHPLQLVSVQLYEPVYGPAGTPMTLLLDDIYVSNGLGAAVDVLDSFDDRNEWSPLATSMISIDSISLTKRDVYRGESAAVLVLGKDTDRGIRGFYRGSGGGPVSIVVSSSFIARTGHLVGDALIVEIMGRLIPVVIRDSVDYFPTLDPRHGGFIVADLDALMAHLNLLSPIARFAPNEVFITEAPGAAQSVRDVVAALAGSTDGVYDREALMESVRLDPLVTAGWRAMIPLSLAIIVISASLGYVVYLLSYANHSRSEMSFLRSLGLSGRQSVGLFGLEHIVILIVGLGLGTWAGFQMSTLMVSSVAVTETGEKVIPPFILMTDWSYMLSVYVALVGIFVVALGWLRHGMMHVDLQKASRTERP